MKLNSVSSMQSQLQLLQFTNHQQNIQHSDKSSQILNSDNWLNDSPNDEPNRQNHHNDLRSIPGQTHMHPPKRKSVHDNLKCKTKQKH